jgi:hypothetical protein
MTLGRRLPADVITADIEKTLRLNTRALSSVEMVMT